MKPIRIIGILAVLQLMHISMVSCQEHPDVKPAVQQSFKLAVCQMKVVGGDRGSNVVRATEVIVEAVQNGAQFILLPEAMDLGWTDPSALTQAETVPGGFTCQHLSDLARLLRVYICSGLIEKDGEKVYNSAVIIDPQGELILHHRKINELDIGHPYYALGD
ncbi:MAG: carbon-nitrogen hydrolase family protein, partial [Bacteroidales bacterium]|nr:carbon-nitrogen hydrolase family protein [Bacteroidales bacterium]